MLAVMVVYLHRQRHIRVCGEVRRTHRRKLRQLLDVFIRRVPMADELVIIHEEMDNLTRWILFRVVVVYRDKFALWVLLDRLNLWNIVPPNAVECELVEIFKVNHIAPSKQKCRKIHSCTLRHSKRPESNRNFLKQSVLPLHHYLLRRLYHIFLTRSTIFFSVGVRFAYPFAPSFSLCIYPWWVCGETLSCGLSISICFMRLFLVS